MLERLEQAHSQHHKTLSYVCDFLSRSQVNFRLHRRSETWPEEFKFDLVLTVGGDGTLLYASHHIAHMGRIVGIRSTDASVGFTCLAGSEGVSDALHNILEDKVTFITCARAQIEVQRVESNDVQLSVPVLNDILYANRSPAATTRYRINLGKRHEVHKSSGVWISTPVGSTAAILAAGGMEQDLHDRNFQFMVRELYRPLGKEYHLLGQTYNPDEEALTIENRTEAAMVALDGQHGEINLEFGDLVTVKRGPDIQLASPENKPS